MVGQWEGSGWMQMGPDKSYFNQTEDIQMKTGGLTMLIEGKGRKEDGTLIHDALATVNWNSQSGQYDFISHVSKGYHSKFKGMVEGEAFIWIIENPYAGTMRYVIKLNDKGQWFEIGERKANDSDVWVQFFEMTLNKK